MVLMIPRNDRMISMLIQLLVLVHTARSQNLKCLWFESYAMEKDLTEREDWFCGELPKTLFQRSSNVIWTLWTLDHRGF